MLDCRVAAVPVAALCASLLPACGEDTTLVTSPEESLAVPFAPGSPWPKFRANALQDGRTRVSSSAAGGLFWEFPTGKGIFSTPVVGADGTVFVGSADRTFYALSRDGSEKWSVLTGEIIDSSALLDDRGRVYFGSGDGHLYALDAATGEPVWTFEADSPEVNQAFINWFEGNVAMAPDGTLYVPNDNWFVYAIDRDTGGVKWKAKMADQTWSLPAVDPATGNLYFGNNNLLPIFGGNTFAYTASGERLWQASSNGSVAASPLLTSDNTLIVGGFDGYVRAYDAQSGEAKWTFGTRDHIYASPAQLPDGTIVQPSSDGTIYGLDPATGAQRWAFDTLEAVRSSPAVDAEGNVYVGSGEGKLFVLRPDGTLRWSMRLISEERNDLNGSPALGSDAIYIAGESGHVFSVPFDYCLHDDGKADPRCLKDTGEALPADGASVLYTTQLGAPLAAPPQEIDANQTMAFSLYVRKAGDTMLALLDSTTLQVTADPATTLSVEVSGDRRFFTVVPTQGFVPDGSGRVRLHIQGQYLVDPVRDGLKFTGGQPGGSFDQSFEFQLHTSGSAYVMPVPAAPGDPSGTWEIYRLAAPLPTILPSYNQIGFDSLHFLMGAVEGTSERFVAWVAGAKLAEAENRTVIDPSTGALFPLEVDLRDGLFTGTAEAGFAVEVMNLVLPLDRFRLTARLDDQGMTAETPRLLVSTTCADIQLYGQFMQKLGLCNTQTDILSVFGAALLRKHGSGVSEMPAGVGQVSFVASAGEITATVTGSSLRPDQHAVAVLLVDADTGRPVFLDYGLATGRSTAADGTLSAVTLKTTGFSGQARAYLMVDTYPAAMQPVTVP